MKELWLSNPKEWQLLPLVEKIERFRKYYCTGPCGQSSSVLATREALNNMFLEVILLLRNL